MTRIADEKSDVSMSGDRTRAVRAQRLGWVGMAALVFAGLLGLLGSGGPFAGTKATTPGLEIEYPRFVRRSAPVRVDLRITPPQQGAPVVLTIGREWLDAVKITGIRPGPVVARATSSGVELEFQTDGAVSVVDAVIHGEVERAGVLRGSIATHSGRIDFVQISYP